ncbi:acyltransferase domain-containing protein [Streptomyces sp. DSM 44915]|uniref:Acyltransferase domain-containing protein n=1 Tax=Streptomyces chisholmiae TaxID=3075540 RepID=A0ABU2JXW3_9ACTN|nr:acyltransferase domain-containing protein [Streptomyces sp. DSM 44915]MDT0269593.1 acyltransferase domain-containing protein [Streptomyces sp. DSM 44915]UZD11002.1 acyltransferase [Marinispora sp. CNQ-140]
MPNTVYLLGGQGSQYFGMVSSLYQENTEFRRSMDRLDAAYRDRFGGSVLEYLYDPRRGLGDPQDDLPRSNAAILMVEYALAELLTSHGVRPDVLVGASLGEFTAMAIAGLAPVEDVLGFVVEAARLLLTAVPAGGMLTVLGNPGLFEELPALHQHTELASVNHDNHFVLSGDTGGLARAANVLKERGLMTVALPVRVPFHSSLLDRVREQVTELAARSLGFGATPAAPHPGAPVLVSSTTADVTPGWGAADCFEILRRPIAFTKALGAVPGAADARYVDLTPSSTLATLMKTSHRGHRGFPISTPFGTEPALLKAVLAELRP